MGRKISEIYEEYKIMPGLQEHMLRVAAVASMICDNFDGPLPKEDIVAACLLHDIANIIKADLKLLPKFLEPEGKEYWQKLKDEYIEKYGQNEHQASLKIIEDLGCNQEVLEIVAEIDFIKYYDLSEKSIAIQITAYADCRVAPLGILSMMDRLEEGRARYKNRTDGISDTAWQDNLPTVLEVEKNIFAKCKIKPEDITDEAVASIIEELKNFVI